MGCPASTATPTRCRPPTPIRTRRRLTPPLRLKAVHFEVLEWATLRRPAIAVITTIMSSVIIIIVTVILTTITYRLSVWSGTSITSVERRALLALTTLLVIEIITMTATTSTSTIVKVVVVVNCRIAVALLLLTSSAAHRPLLPPPTLDPMVVEVVVVVVVISSSSFEVAAPAERASTAVRRTCEVSVISPEELVLAPLPVAAAEVAAAAGEA